MKYLLKTLAVIALALIQFALCEEEYSIITYNVWMMPWYIRMIIRSGPSVSDRARMIPDALKLRNADVAIIEEIFDDDTSEIWGKEMTRIGYPYSTKLLKASTAIGRWFKASGGVRIFSKHVIETEDFIQFRNTARGEFMVSKGCVYAKVLINKRPIHVFGTHLQAGNGAVPGSIRKKQLQQIRAFADTKLQGLSGSHRGYFGGDFNVDLYENADTGDYTRMLEILGAEDPELKGEQIYTIHGYESENITWPVNPFAHPSFLGSSPKNEKLDYIFSIKSLSRASNSSCTIFRPQATTPYIPVFDQFRLFKSPREPPTTDLSDHYAVQCKYSGPSLPAETAPSEA